MAKYAAVARFVLVSALVLSTNVFAQTSAPVTGRWQELYFSESDTAQASTEKYNDLLAELQSKGTLDDDKLLFDRVQRVGASIIAAIPKVVSGRDGLHWELHTSSDSKIEGLSMAGGRVVLGSRFVRGLDLNDGELATLLAHEISHVVARHQTEELSEVRLLRPLPNVSAEIVMQMLDAELSLQLKMARLSWIQESEADQIGMTLAHAAGWPATDMVHFYEKLAKSEVGSMYASGHPSAEVRISMAKGMAKLFE